MFTAGMVWDEVLGSGRIKTSERLAQVIENCNKSYFEICAKLSWIDLRAQKTLDFSTQADATGLWLPSDLVGIDAVVYINADTGEYVQYRPRDEAQVDPGEEAYRWYYSDVSKDPLMQASSGATIAKNSNTVTFAQALSATAAGEYIVFADKLGYYRVVSMNEGLTQAVITPSWKGESLESAGYQIRPEQTRKMALIDNAGASDESEVELHYWTRPQPLYQRTQAVLLPAIRPLVLSTMIKMTGEVDKREQAADRYRTEYRQAEADMMKLNPDFGGFNAPRDKGFSPFRFGRNRIFLKRTTT